VGRRSSARSIPADPRPPPLRLAGGVVGILSGRVVGRVEHFGDLGNLVLDQALDPGLERDVGGAAALTPAAHLQVDYYVLDVDELDPAAVGRDRRVDRGVDQLLDLTLQLYAHNRLLSDSYCTRLPAKGQLALGGLRSAEPRFGEPGRALPAGVEPRRHRGPRWLARRLLGKRPHTVERQDWVLGRLRRPGDRGLHRLLQPVHPRVRVGPPVVEVALDERAE